LGGILKTVENDRGWYKLTVNAHLRIIVSSVHAYQLLVRFYRIAIDFRSFHFAYAQSAHMQDAYWTKLKIARQQRWYRYR